MHLKIFDHCKKNEIIFLSTPYDIVSAELLLDVGVKAFKIASSDTNNIPFLSFLANRSVPKPTLNVNILTAKYLAA